MIIRGNIKVISYFLICCAVRLSSQNWEVFNHQYRYNYKFNNSVVVSQVLFADTVKPSGSDTVFCLNRIGVKCTGACPTLTVALSPTTSVMLVNMPQFLQRKIKKFNNGVVMLFDTARLILKPNCLVNQTWLFDSVNNKQAVCLSKSTKTVFGVNDSVKNILVAGSDTIIVSKNFGIIQFPQLYGQNKYYRLSGIERAASYDSVALVGEKVPNAWDIYRFDTGDKFCYRNYGFVKPVFHCYYGNMTIISRSVIPGGYQYQVNKQTDSCRIGGPGNANAVIGPRTSSVAVFTSLSSPALSENSFYPGKIIQDQFLNPMIHNIINFGQDNNGVFYKFAGSYCFTNTTSVNFPVSPLGTMDDLGTWTGSYFNLDNNTGMIYRLKIMYGTGLGCLTYDYANTGFGDWETDCQTCAVKKGVLYYGTETFVGLTENKASSSVVSVYPNPVGSFINVETNGAALKLVLVDLLGQSLLCVEVEEGGTLKQFDVSAIQSGVYLLNVYNNSTLINSVRIIK